MLDLASRTALDHVGAIPRMESWIFYCNKGQLRLWFCLSILYYAIPLFSSHRPRAQPRAQSPDILHQNAQNPAIYRKEKQTREEQPRDETRQPEKLQTEALVEPEDLYIVSSVFMLTAWQVGRERRRVVLERESTTRQH